jgi:hypothetical protein
VSTVTIPAGAQFVNVPVSAILDEVVDDGETVTLTLQADPANQYTLTSPTAASVTITDGSPTITVSAISNPAETSGANGTFGTTGVFRILASRAPTRDVTINYAVSGTAVAGSTWTPGAHYQTLLGSTVLASGTLAKDIAVRPFNDTLLNPGETVVVTVSPGTGFVLGSSTSAQVTIADNDTDPNVATPTRVTSTNADGTYTAGQALTIAVNYSQSVVVTGTPYLVLNCGAADRRATYSGGNVTYSNGSTGGTSLYFRYVVDSGDSTDDLDLVSANALILPNGAQINDLSDNYAYPTLPTPGTFNSLSGQKNLVIQGAVPGTEAPGKPSTAFEDGGDSTGKCGSGGIGAILATMALWLMRRRQRG